VNMSRLRDIIHDKVGMVNYWYFLANHANREPFVNNGHRIVIRAAMCNCEEAQANFDVLLTASKQIHCNYCGKLLETKPLLGITEEGKWIDRGSGKQFSVSMQNTMPEQENQSSSAPSQGASW